MIDYKLLDDSIKYYESNGYRRIETPWTVSEYVDNITKPKDGRPSFKLSYNNKCLVASGEQSFLYQYLKGFIPKGMFQTITPCFRFETFDFLHTQYFLKNELIRTDIVNNEALNRMVTEALNFYKTYLPDSKVIKTEIGYDIVCNGTELGSYGIRECEFLKWIYGTGCAEPRLSTMINYGISHK